MSWRAAPKPHQGLKATVSVVPTYLYQNKDKYNTKLDDTTIKILDFYLTYIFDTIRLTKDDFTNIMEGDTLNTMISLLHRALYTATIKRGDFVLTEPLMDNLEEHFNSLIKHATFTHDYVLQFKHNDTEILYNPYEYLNKIDLAFSSTINSRIMVIITHPVGVLLSKYHAMAYYFIAETLRANNLLSKRKKYTYWGGNK